MSDLGHCGIERGVLRASGDRKSGVLALIGDVPVVDQRESDLSTNRCHSFRFRGGLSKAPGERSNSKVT